MMKISDRITGMASSPIRKLTPLADRAKSRGIKIYHLNIGQPDIRTSAKGLASLKTIDRTVLEYSPSEGFYSLRKKISAYYAEYGMDFSPEEITVTTGASEAVLFAFLTCMDPGDELITTEPTYANYLAFAEVAGVKVRTLKTSIENGFALPQVEHFEELITPRTKAILICNPNNPSGTLYDRKEMQMLADIVRKHGLYLFSDEVYREFVYDGMEYFSAGHFDGLDENVVMLDSFSKRYSECGIRVGALITRNRAITQGVLKLCQARLSPPLLGQIVAEASCDEDPSYLDNVIKEYDSRRKVLIESLSRIPGVKVSTPHGAFYAMAALPVDDAEKFCAWCLSDFQYEGESIMMAPANGFYITPGLGINEVRMAYVLKSEDLRRAVTVLEKALEAYPGRTLR